jgi:predicted hydrocarbon binding protein
MALKLEYTFNPETYRHYINGHPTVLHCHHYMSLTTKLAEEFVDIGGSRILRESAEDSIRPLFDSYYQTNGLSSSEDRFKVGEEYYSVMGLGRIAVTGNQHTGEVILIRSHVDEGWIKKWGKHDKPINHFTCGYISALFAATFGRPPRSYSVSETASLVMGDEQGMFQVTAS